MKVYLTPVRPAGIENKTIEYSFQDEKITSKLDEITESYDFSELPNGRMEIKESLLEVVVSAKRVDGVLWVKLKNYVGPNDDSHPEWKEHTEIENATIDGDGEVAKIEWKTKEEIDAEIAEAERLASIPSEVEQLKAKLKASTEHTDFLEEVIVEMAQVVYEGD